MSNIDEKIEDIIEPEEADQLDNDEIEKVDKQGGFDNFSDEEKKAYADGWRPKDEYDGENWAPASTFNRIKSQNDEIKKLKKQNEDNNHLRDRLEELEKTVTSNSESSIEALEVQAQEDFDNGDREAYEQKQEKIRQLKKKSVKQNDPQQPYEIKEWQEKNEYIFEVSDKSYFAKEAFKNLNEHFPDAPLSQKLKRLDELVDEKFSKKSQKNLNRERPSMTSSRPSQGGRTVYANFKDLPKAEREKCHKSTVYNHRNEDMWKKRTEDNYLKNYNQKLQEKN